MDGKAITNYSEFLKKRGYGVRTREEYAREILVFLKWLGGPTSSPPTAPVYRKYLEHLKRQSKKPKTISKHLSALKTYSKFLKVSKMTRKNEAKFIPHPTLQKRGINILEDRDLTKLRKQLDKDALTSTLFETLLQTGMTISEASPLRRHDIIFVKGPKYGKIKIKDRAVPINNRLENILKVHLAKNNRTTLKYVFPNRYGRPLNVRFIRTKLTKLFKASGLKNFYVNDLRHNFIYGQLAKGADPFTVARWVGFKNLSSLSPFLQKMGKRVGGLETTAEV